MGPACKIHDGGTRGQKAYRLCSFENHLIEFYGKEKHTAKILGIYLTELDKKTLNYPPMKVRMKWSLDPFERLIARKHFATFITSTL